MHRLLGMALLATALGGPAYAGDGMVGTWSGGSMALSVMEDGRFDWSVGSNRTDGHWSADDKLVSLETDRGKRTYAYRVEGDELTLYEADGSELVMKREKRKTRRR